MAQSSTSTSSGGKDLWYYFASAIGILITFGFGFLPPIEPITPIGMKVFGIFMGMIFLWSFVNILWPSLLGIVALIICGYAPLPKVLQMSFGDTVAVLVLFIMVLFGAIQNSGVTHYISRWFLTRKVINGKPLIFSFIFIYATYVLSALVSVLPALLFMWAILYSVLEDVGYKKGDKYTAIMIIGTMFGAISGQAAKPFTGSALMISGAYEKASGIPLNYLHYMLMGFILSTIGVVLYTLLIKFVFRPDMSKIKDISIERFQRDPLPPMDLHQKFMMASLFGYMVLILLPSILPKSIGAVALLSKIGPFGIVVLILIAFSIFKINNKPIVNFREVAAKHVPWDVYFLICMAMAISSAMTAPTTGITDFMKIYLDPILGGHSTFTFVTILVLFSIGITQFANNGVMGVLLMPVIKVFAEQSGANYEATASLLIFALHIALLTPAASPYAAILYGNKAWVSQREVLKYGLAILIMSAFLFTVIGVPVMRMIY